MKFSEVKLSYTEPCPLHIQYQGYRKSLYSFKEDFVQGVFLEVEESCTRRVLFGVKRSCAHLAKGVCQVVYKAFVVGVHK